LQVTIQRTQYDAAVAKRADPHPDASPLQHALGRIGDKWSLLLIAALLDGPRRFGDLLDELPGLAPNILTQRLRHLEREALLVARPYQERPPRFSYELTASGAELAGALRLLADWGGRQADADPPRHADCGTPLEVRWWCPSCETPVDDPDADETHVV
jgi:DNA-binding HxlR family transcriptional regulator